MDYKNMKVKELREKVKERGCIGYSSLKKQELIDILKSEDCGHLKKKEPKTLKKSKPKIISPISISSKDDIEPKIISPISISSKDEKYKVFTKKELENKSFNELEKLGKKYGYNSLLDTREGMQKILYYRTDMSNLSPEEFINFTKKVKWAVISKNDCSLCIEIENILIDKKIRYISYTPANKEQLKKINKKYNTYDYPIVLNYGKIININHILSDKNLYELSSIDDINLYIRKKFTSKVGDKIFKGETHNMFNIMLYFSWVYENSCIILNKKFSKDHKLSITYVIDNDKFLFYENFYNDIKTCYNDDNYRFIIIVFTLLNVNIYSHATVLIYDKKSKEMEWFDPNVYDGKFLQGYKDLSLKLPNLFNKNVNKNMVKKFYQPFDFCPVGLQHIQENEREMDKNKDPGGFCTSWSFWFIELRLSNSNVSREKLLDYAMHYLVLDKKSLTKFIRSYSKFLDMIIEAFEKCKKYKNYNDNSLKKCVIEYLNEVSI